MDSSEAGVLSLCVGDAFSCRTGSANGWPSCISKELLGVAGGVGHGSICLVVVPNQAGELLNISENEGLEI